MNSLLDMFNYFCAQMMRNKVTADLSSNGSSSSFSSFSAVQAVSVEKSTKNVSVEKGMSLVIILTEQSSSLARENVESQHMMIHCLSRNLTIKCCGHFLEVKRRLTIQWCTVIDMASQILQRSSLIHKPKEDGSFYQLATTRTWDYLGLSAANAKNLLNETNMGEQSIIGIVDKGLSVNLYIESSVAFGFFVLLSLCLKHFLCGCRSGNSGPEAQTVTNTAPWILTVVATTLDRSFPTPITLGKDREILGQAMYTGPKLGFNSLDYPENPGNNSESFRFLFFNSNRTMAGKVVLCFTTSSYSSSVSNAARDLKRGGGLGVIIARQPGYLRPCLDDFPCVTDMWTTSLETIYFFTYVPIYPVVKIQPSRTLTGQPVATKMATFSSRGPNSIAARSSK
ncbi:hypothetical protein Bca52824_002748 [Brassica carinata]|uniref:Uncharacterized protein n=1 Tax=Brassica carinata TaxID=52824 RepID=A0A8X8BEK9_BRACI|nr:hypothetical protein Bca52824_002748 [Brassica carinata]